MTPAEKILEALGEKALQPRALWAALKNEQPAAIEAALSMLQRSGQITFELGHYQRGNVKKPLPPPSALISIPQRLETVVVDAHEPPPLKRASPGRRYCPRCRKVKASAEFAGPGARACEGCAKPVGRPSRGEIPAPAPAPGDPLTPRQRQVFDLAERGRSGREISKVLGLSEGCVSTHLSFARAKMAGSRLNSAPSAAVQLSVVSSREDAGPATVGADLPRKRITFSPELTARLIEEQRSLAMALQAALDRVSHMRQRLGDVEELVRMATAKEPG
jgi:DNA-binding CsgD family transcriptional regulator